MSGPEYVFDGTRENFRQLVLENSHRGAVLVNYWAPGAGPCFRLWQVLEGLSQAYQGRFLLVNINTDTQKSLVRDNAITSVPTIKIYRNGSVVESIYGAQSESSLRASIDRHVSPARDTAIGEAIRQYQSGDVDAALQTLAQAHAAAPVDPKPCTTAMKLLLREQRYADVEEYYSTLATDVQAEPDISALRVHARMLHLAEQAPPVAELERRLAENPDQLDALLSRAALAMVQDEYETALDLLLRALEQDPGYHDELARKAMLAIFALLGSEHELTRRYQDAMRRVLH
ncbi:MAG TPA: tetratricopeptide repeat protein [Gammaproteobacteria bacterium]|nr:tetratricopeptide repeat protein [Gammaproteobacteria bacterium]